MVHLAGWCTCSGARVTKSSHFSDIPLPLKDPYRALTRSHLTSSNSRHIVQLVFEAAAVRFSASSTSNYENEGIVAFSRCPARQLVRRRIVSIRCLALVPSPRAFGRLLTTTLKAQNRRINLHWAI